MLDIVTQSGTTEIISNPAAGSVATGTPVPPTPINPYSVLSVPAYYRACVFLAVNLASFSRGVLRDGMRPGARQRVHPLTAVIDGEPNPYTNADVLWRTWYFHGVHTGNGFLRVERDGAARVTRLHTLLPEDVWPFRYAVGTETRQAYYHRAARVVLDAADVLHLQSLGHDGMAGLDPVQLHAATFQRALTQTRFMTLYMQRGTMIRGVIEIPYGVSPENRANLRRDLDAHFSVNAGGNKRDVLILSDGAKLTNSTVSPGDAGLNEQAKWTVREISQITGVPPQYLFDFADSKFNVNAEQMGLDVVRFTFRTWIKQAATELTQKLLAPSERARGLTVGINADDLLKGDTTTQTNTTIAKVNAGIMTPNEGRAELGLPPLADPEANKIKRVGDTSKPGGPNQPGRPADGAPDAAAGTGNPNQTE